MISLIIIVFNSVLFNNIFSTKTVNTSELLLYSDSLDCNHWADYGISLQRGSFSDPEWAFRKALSINSECINATRGLAVMYSAKGNYTKALEELAQISIISDPLSLILAISIHQELVNTRIANDYISDINNFQDLRIRNVAFFLQARQYLFEEDTLKAELLLDTCIANGVIPEIITIAKIEKANLTNSIICIDDYDVINAFYFNITFLGGVYTELLLKYTDSDYDEFLIPTRFAQCIYGNAKAFKTLPDEPFEQLEMNTKIWLAYLLFNLTKHNEAMIIVDDLIAEDSTLVDPWIIKGLILLRNDMYFETIEMMSLASIYNEDQLELTAIAGLSAEMGGYSKLALETYCNVLSIHPDSIVLINRLRNAVTNEAPDFNFNNDSFDNLEHTANDLLNGSLSFNYSNSSGDLDQYSFGSSFQLSHSYGLYGSTVSATGTLYKANSSNDEYSNQDSNIALEMLHQNTISTFSSYVASVHDWQFIKNGTQFQVSSTIGEIYEPSIYLRFSPELGFGVEFNKWEEDANYQNNFVSIFSVYSEFRGDRLSNLLPTTSLTFRYTQDLDAIDRYSLESDWKSSFRLTHFFSFMFGYSLDYNPSLPPEYENTLRTNSFAQFGIYY